VEVGFFGSRRVVQAADGGPHGVDEGHGGMLRGTVARPRCGVDGRYDELSTRLAGELRGPASFFTEQRRMSGAICGRNIARMPVQSVARNHGICSQPKMEYARGLTPGIVEYARGLIPGIVEYGWRCG
jgi:hypothetical protein